MVLSLGKGRALVTWTFYDLLQKMRIGSAGLSVSTSSQTLTKNIQDVMCQYLGGKECPEPYHNPY